MASGYFDNGVLQVELGYHVCGQPSPTRRVLQLEPHARPAAVLDDGGGPMTIAVRGQRQRANLGDAERYAYELLAALAVSEPGTLGLEDNLGNRAIFADAVCISAAAEVTAFRFVEIDYTFHAPEQSIQPGWGAVPAAPGTYAGATTEQAYVAGGVAIGQYGVGMRIEMQRQFPVIEVPRARGARARGPQSGAAMLLRVAAQALTTGQHLAAYLEGLARDIGALPVDLSGNGVIYADCILRNIQPGITDGQATEFTAEFIQQADAGCAAAGATTTPGG